jgi:hypothetical protein
MPRPELAGRIGRALAAQPVGAVGGGPPAPQAGVSRTAAHPLRQLQAYPLDPAAATKESAVREVYHRRMSGQNSNDREDADL